MSPDDPEDLAPGVARERTKLAWTRTSIAFAALGAILLRFEPVIGIVVLAAVPLVWALGRVAVRQTRPELLSRRLLLVAVIVTAVSLLAVVVAVTGHGPASLEQLLHR